MINCNYQLLILDHRLSSVTCQLSAITYRLSLVKYQLSITNKHHDPLERPKDSPAKLTMKKEDAEDLVRLSKQSKNPKLQQALEKLAKRKLDTNLL